MLHSLQGGSAAGSDRLSCHNRRPHLFTVVHAKTIQRIHRTAHDYTLNDPPWQHRSTCRFMLQADSRGWRPRVMRGRLAGGSARPIPQHGCQLAVHNKHRGQRSSFKVQYPLQNLHMLLGNLSLRSRVPAASSRTGHLHCSDVSSSPPHHQQDGELEMQVTTCRCRPTACHKRRTLIDLARASVPQRCMSSQVCCWAYRGAEPGPGVPQLAAAERVGGGQCGDGGSSRTQVACPQIRACGLLKH